MSPLRSDGARADWADAATDPLPFCYDPWEMEEQLRHIQRVLDPEGVLRADELDASTKAAYERELSRLDPRHAGSSSAQPPPAGATANHPTSQYRITPVVLTWLTLCLGTAASSWGMVLLGWSVVAGGNGLWPVTLALTFGGQAILLAGLMLRHERLHTPAGVDKVDRRLDGLKTAATAVTDRRAHRNNFYTRSAEDADPRQLLRDLKEQLDRLAIEIGRESTARTP